MPLTKEKIKSINFHVKSRDYFGTLATVINNFAQDSKYHGHVAVSAEDLNKIADELVYLQLNFNIHPKLPLEGDDITQ